MDLRKRAVTAAVAVGLLGTLGASTAAADTVEPLNQYVVSGKVDTDALARAGFDLRESSVTGQKGKFFIVARPSEVAALEKGGATVTAPFGLATAMVAPPSPLAQPTHGYDVFRPWSLTPAPCPGTCSTPLVNLKTYYHRLARANPDVVKEVVIGRSDPRPGHRRLQGHEEREPRARRQAAGRALQLDAARARVDRGRDRAPALHLRRRAQEPEGRRRAEEAPGKNELWFVPVVNPDGYDYTFVDKGTRLWRKNLRDLDGGGFSQDTDGVDTNRNWPTNWNFDLEGSSDDPTNETYHGTGPASEPEVQADARAGAADRLQVPDRLPLVRAADPLSRGLAGRDARLRRAADGRARRR